MCNLCLQRRKSLDWRPQAQCSMWLGRELGPQLPGCSKQALLGIVSLTDWSREDEQPRNNRSTKTARETFLWL